MKSFAVTALLLVMLCNCAPVNAQTTASLPKLFNNYNNTINCQSQELERIFALANGSSISVSFEGNFILQGVITSSLQKYSNLKTVIIRSSNFDNALFSISKRTKDDNTVMYTGRILHDNYADGYELKMTSSGNYFLNKINLGDILQDR